MRRILVIFKAVTKNWLRSRAGLFFSFLFPLMLLLVFGAIFGKAGYYMPGVTAAFIMTNGVVGLTSTASEFKRRGIIKRLSVTPLKRLDWIVGNVLSQALLDVILTAFMIVAGYLLFGLSVSVNLYAAGLIVSAAVLFSGIGMLLAGLIKDAEAAAGLGNAIAFPMMFLSGAFLPLTTAPGYVQVLSYFMPLTYFSNGLRASMVLGEYGAAAFDLALVTALAVLFVLLGSLVTRWKE